MARLIWTDPALDQLDAIADYIALDDLEAARRFVKKVFVQTDRIKSFQTLGRSVPELKNSAFRQVWEKPGWIYYRTERNTVYIVHVRRAEQLLRLDDLSE